MEKILVARMIASFSILFPLLSLLLITYGCSNKDHTDNLIPESFLAGSGTPARIFYLETQQGKAIKGGLSINALAAVPYDITREQVKPTLLECILDLRKKNRDCEWITVSLCAEGRKGIYAGRCEYKEGEINLSYGVPDQDQLDAEKTAIDYYRLIHEPPRLLTRTEFDQAADICDLYSKYTATLADEDLKRAGSYNPFDQDIYDSLVNSRADRVFKKVASELNLSEKKVRKLRNSLMRYYVLTWGEETIR